MAHKTYPSALWITVVLLVCTLTSCAGYVPGRQTYWDHQVKELCEKDGGMTILERIRISRADVERGIQPRVWILGKRFIGAAVRELAHPDALVHYEENHTVIREMNPSVGRTELVFIRRKDGATIGKYVYYGRGGGDFPTGLTHDSSFLCPTTTEMAAATDGLFIVEGE